MQNHYTITDFMKQFRLEHIVYPGYEKKPHVNFFFRQFKGRRDEIAILDACLVDKMGDKKIIGRLFEKLREKDLADLTKLSSFMQGLQKKLTAYARKEPGTAKYYQHLLPALQQFTTVISSFYEQIRNDLLNKLRLPVLNLTGPENLKYFNSSEIDIILAAIEIRSGELKKYFTHFNGLIQQESDDPRRIAVTSEIHHYYSQLVNLIGRVIINTSVTSSRLIKWQVKLSSRETQELYN